VVLVAVALVLLCVGVLRIAVGLVFGVALVELLLRGSFSPERRASHWLTFFPVSARSSSLGVAG
jgi:hypothetical protein